MTIMAYKQNSYNYVGIGGGSTASEAIEDFKTKYKTNTGIDWDEDAQGKLYVPIYELYPGL